MWGVALAVGFIVNPEFGFLLAISSSLTRKSLKEQEYWKHFSIKYWYLIYPSVILMLIFVGRVLFTSLSVYPWKSLNFIEYIKPLLVLVPVMLFYEYRFYQQNS